MAAKVTKRFVMPKPKAPCLDCSDRFVKDGHTCHETCEKYLKFRNDRYEVWKAIQEEVNKDRLVDQCCVDMALKNSRKKRVER